MKKLNNKGFAISSILYSIMVLFLMLLLSILGILGSRKATLDRTKKDILDELNSNYLSNRFSFEHRNITVVNSGNKDDIMYALMDGVSAIDENGNLIPKENISYDLDVDTIENRDYVVTYTATNNQKTITGTRTITFTDIQTVNNYSYTGNVQNFSPKYDGNYKIELWGASGGDASSSFLGGAGAYTSGVIDLQANQKIYVYVGGQGMSDFEYVSDSVTDPVTKYTWNSIYYKSSITFNNGTYSSKLNNSVGMAGGGATDIRLTDGNWDDFLSLKSRIMVASGGSGAVSYHRTSNGIPGGTLVGLDGARLGNGTDGNIPTGGTQTSAGIKGNGKYGDLATNGEFGLAGQAVYATGSGGAGYYGGGASPHSNSLVGLGGSGSSFISGYDGCDAIAESSTADNIVHTGQSIHYSNYKFNNGIMYAGNEEMPNHAGNGKITGNNGNGYAKISLIYYY